MCMHHGVVKTDKLGKVLPYLAKYQRGLLFFRPKSQTEYFSQIVSTTGTLLLLVGLDIKNTEHKQFKMNN